MAKVPQEVVQNAGVDLDELRKKLIRAAAAEFTTYYYPHDVYPIDLTFLERDVRPIPCYPVQVRGEDVLVALE